MHHAEYDLPQCSSSDKLGQQSSLPSQNLDNGMHKPLWHWYSLVKQAVDLYKRLSVSN